MNGFSTAVSGLLASQRALYVINHNIVNAKTNGYSRQEALQGATSPDILPGIGFLGSGTEIYDIVRVRNSYTDFKYWLENSPYGEWKVKKDTLNELEKLFGEPSNSSFRKYMDDFFSSMEELSKNPSDYAFREPVRQTALSLAKHINETAERLSNLKEEIGFTVGTKVKEINKIGEQIANLNRQIYSLELDGKKANDLRDKRELLIDNLSKIVNVRVDESKEGKFRVSISGISLVDHVNVNKIEFKPENPEKVNDPKELYWSNGNKLEVKSGELSGYMDLLKGDGSNGGYRGVPFYIEKLDEFAKGFADKINEVHSKGYGLNGETGKAFFEPKDGKDITASNITLSKDILDDLANIACAEVEDGVEDNKNLLKLIKLREDKTFFSGDFSQGTPDDFIKSILSNLAVDSSQAARMDSTEKLIINNILRKRQSESGVSLDEEMGNIVKYQHIYNASARMVTTIDMILDVTINRLGMVGR